ncbi:MAG: DsbA family protein [Alphaproteobacteria bacterium]|nr:DsbA family protein [Alphaproteobacteria bacterium SS10]
MTRMTWKLLTLSAALMTAAAISVASPSTGWAQSAGDAITDTANVSVPGAPETAGEPVAEPGLLDERVLGDPDAPVTLFEYSSMTCPHCAAFHSDTLPKLKRDYIDTGKVKIVYRDYPFDGVALRASMLARCVPPARYFDFIDVLFKNQQRWARSRNPEAALRTFGQLVGLDAAAVDACLANDELQEMILKTQLEAQERFNVRSTPTFIINNNADRVIGAEDYEVFQRKIDRLLPDEAS